MVAILARLTGDLDLAEKLAQDALVDALGQWPRQGAPANPGPWLAAVGKRKAIDRFRRDRTLAGKYAQLGGSHRALAAGPAQDGPEPRLLEERAAGSRARAGVAAPPIGA